jgi:hypothetical protein
VNPNNESQRQAFRARRKLSSEFLGKSVKLLPWEVVKAERTGKRRK